MKNTSNSRRSRAFRFNRPIRRSARSWEVPAGILEGGAGQREREITKLLSLVIVAQTFFGLSLLYAFLLRSKKQKRKSDLVKSVCLLLGKNFLFGSVAVVSYLASEMAAVTVLIQTDVTCFGPGR